MGLNRTGIENEEIQCACGCGDILLRFDKYGRERKYISGHNTKTTAWKIEHSRKVTGYKHTEEHNKALSERMRGKGNPSWKGGRVIKESGYVWIHNPEHPFSTPKGYVYEHRLVMEKALGRYLTTEERIHHINENRSDNRLENLQLFDGDSEHIKHHWAMGSFDEKVKNAKNKNPVG